MSNLSNRWNDYRPSKSVWGWSCAGAAALTLIVGFGFGGWVTGGTAQERAETSTHDAVAELAADVCAHRVLASADAASVYGELKEARSWERRRLLEEAGWTTFGNADKPISGAADLCATQILAADLPVQAPEAATAGAGASQQGETTAHDPDTQVLEDGAEDVS